MSIKALIRSLGYDVKRHPMMTPLDENLRVLLNELAVNCVLDVGARYGDYGRRLRRMGYEDRIVSFEPVASSFAILQEQADPDWFVHQIALGNSNERLTIAQSAEPGSDSFLKPSAYALRHFGERVRSVGQEEVEVTTLDEIFADAIEGLERPRVLLKVDTQGWDREVLLGAERSLRLVDALQLEVSVVEMYEGEPSYLDLLSVAREHGFVPIWFEPVIFDRMRMPPQFDCLLRMAPSVGSSDAPDRA